MDAVREDVSKEEDFDYFLVYLNHTLPPLKIEGNYIYMVDGIMYVADRTWRLADVGSRWYPEGRQASVDKELYAFKDWAWYEIVRKENTDEVKEA